MCQLVSAGIQTEIYPKHRIRESKNILVALEHRHDLSIPLILLMRKQRWRDFKRFVQSLQPLLDRLGTRTQISESLWCNKILCRRSLALQKVFIDGVHSGQLAPRAQPVDKCSIHRSFFLVRRLSATPGRDSVERLVILKIQRSI